MKIFQINEQQIQQIWNSLVDFPVGKVINVVDMIRNLTLIEVEKPIVEENKPD